MEGLVLFLLTFIFLFIMYQFIFIRPLKKTDNKKIKKLNKELLEVKYLKKYYSLDYDKISYPQLLQICAIVSSLDMAIVVTIVSMISSFLWEIVVGFVSMGILIVISYHFVYLFYKKKGMVKRGKHK